ncbi:MAG: hypothetical protein LBT46_01640 [Planctomycetaceae bacterium]|jgi:tetratricopeptide (TPR) repeat protein|nr:hypothetical protein [Planctomycetaceae bacterium]
MSTELPPEPNTEEQQPPKRRVVEETVSEYIVSWKWLLSGVLFFAITVCGLFGLYQVRSLGMSSHILDTVKDMVNKAEADKTASATETNTEEKRELFSRSLKGRMDAANLLNNYRLSEKTPNSAVLEELYSILDSLYSDLGGTVTSAGAERGRQLSDICVVLVQTLEDVDSIKYLARLLELEWDRRNFAGILDRGKALLQADQRTNGRENYDALRYITMALFERLPVSDYNPLELQLPAASFPREMDDLLKRVYLMKPEDVDITSRYAEFIVDVTRPAFAKCATNDLLRKLTKGERETQAKNIINDMVSRNQDRARAYLVRYHFLSRYLPTSNLQDRADADLQTVLKLEPSNPEALILSSRDAFRQMQVALRDKKEENAAQWKKKGEDLLRKAVADNPGYGIGYQYLGDFLVSEGKQDEALQVWQQGVKMSSRWMTEELLGRMILVLLDRMQTDEVKRQLDAFSAELADMRITRPQAVASAVNMRSLLTARLYVVESQIAQTKIETSKADVNSADTRKLFSLIQQKRADALQLYDGLLKSFGKSRNDYVLEQSSVYYRLLPQSLMIAGRLKMDQGIWDNAVEYFNAAMPFPQTREQAMLAAAGAYQQGNRMEDSTRMLGLAAKQDPNNIAVRFAYANSLFRSQLSVTVADPAALDTVKQELTYLEEHRSELKQPWVIDIRLIHLEMTKASLSNSADTILAAQNEAVKKFRELESKTLPPDAKGKVIRYDDDAEFVAELVGIYSGLSAIADFERLLPKLREFPNGEAAYYAARVNDCLRRDDKDGAIAVVEQANSSEKLSASQKERFVSILQSLRGGNPSGDNQSALEKVYAQLKTTFDQNPESLKPQAFFMLANMALDREDYENAKIVCDRLQKVEGTGGTMWRYITVRIMLSEKVPDFGKIRQRYEEIIKERSQWDMAYVLGATIEDHFLEANPDDTDAKARLINALQLAITNGNTQPPVWGRLISLYEQGGRTDDARSLMRDAALRGVVMDAQTGQFPQPYSRMFSQIQTSIANEDVQNADTVARQCVTLAEKRHEKPELIFALNLAIGKAFFDAAVFDSAKRHLSIAARRGGAYVYPLAVCLAKAGEADKGFTLLLDEIGAMPSSMPTLLPAVLVLLSQVKPTEAVYQRIDRLMNRIEQGERLTMSGKLEKADTDNEIPLGTKRVRSLSFRFPDGKVPIDPKMIRFVPPEKPAPAVEPAVTPALTPASQPAPVPASVPVTPVPEPASATPVPVPAPQ